ncbi:GNAT family N-acetyltransferase [Cetobacterium somerae]|uniref:GNAT family N-acetyltransferase n=1 Tax=Cetobacterium TaxID=180162 RepID=UPI001F06D243|nr:GNAT family N-acetyltransferase [Cetobacterium somerae]MCX3067775.1 GNAT family N-acetyltransferase [Cetobacterium somerae]UPO98934.1 GNAT family N-acetyltransferase [Cetobacterium somerae]
MKLEMKKSNLNDGVDVYRFLCDLGIGENGFHMTPPSDKTEFKELLKKFLKDSEEIQPIGRVMQEIYWMYINNEIVGILKLRPQLNENLLINGGNMGVSISPKFRGNGYGKLIIKKGVELLKEKGVYKILITIYEDNIPSRKAVESNGGVLYDINEDLCRYWIDNTVNIDNEQL